MVELREDNGAPHSREDEIDRLMCATPHGWRGRWCEGGPCACLGCANVSGALVKLGLTKDEWAASLKRLRNTETSA